MVRTYIRIGLLIGVLGISLMCAAPGRRGEDSPLAGNDGCLMCHPTFRDEPIVANHARVGHRCADCHGLSREHAISGNDKVKPEVAFRHDQVDDHCSQCHKPDDHPRQQMERFVEQYRGFPGPNGRIITSVSICTDCHGRHMMPDPITGEYSAGCQCP
jgi:hypothetical protein